MRDRQYKATLKAKECIGKNESENEPPCDENSRAFLGKYKDYDRENAERCEVCPQYIGHDTCVLHQDSRLVNVHDLIHE
jgi:hypothetical protein